MDPRAERREHAHPPVADLIAEALHDDRPVVGDRAGRLHLLLEIGDEVPRCQLVEADVATQPLERGVATRATERPRERAHRAAELDGATRLVAVPERHPSLFARRGSHDHPVPGDVLDPPGRGAEDDHVASPALVDHLLVELADTNPVGEEDREQAAIRDGPAGRDRDPARAIAGPDGAGGSVPDEPRTKLRETVARVAPGQHVEDREEDVLRELREGGRAPDRVVELVHAALLDRAHRHQLLSEHVERVPWIPRVLDLAREHPLRHDRRLQQVTAELREDPATRGLADLVSGSTDPLQAACDRAGGLDLDHEVHGAHVDAEFERRGGDDRPEASLLQGVFDLEPLLAGQRPVVRTHEVLAGELVQAGGQTLGQPPRVREHDRGTVLADQFEEPRVDRRPDRVPRLLAVRGVVSIANRCACVQRDPPAHVLDGDDDLKLHGLAMPGVHDRDRPFDAVDRAAQEPGDLLERPLRGGQADPLGRLFAELLQPLEREREVSPALGRRHRVDLVDDDGADASERLSRGGRQHQIEGLGRRDQDVRRAPDHPLAVARRGVAGADRDRRRVRQRRAEPIRRMLDPRERRAEVLLDVHGEGAER